MEMTSGQKEEQRKMFLLYIKKKKRKDLKTWTSETFDYNKYIYIVKNGTHSQKLHMHRDNCIMYSIFHWNCFKKLWNYLFGRLKKIIIIVKIIIFDSMIKIIWYLWCFIS